MAIVIRYMCCLVFISRSSDLIQYGGIVTKANSASTRSVSKALRCSTHCQGITQLYLHTIFIHFVQHCFRQANFPQFNSGYLELSHTLLLTVKHFCSAKRSTNSDIIFRQRL